MELTIIAATGGVGRLMLERAVAAGHHVTAVARHPDHPGAGVRAVTVDFDAPDITALRGAVQGADAVLSGLGPRRASEAGIASRGPRRWSKRCRSPEPGGSSSSARRRWRQRRRPVVFIHRSTTRARGSSPRNLAMPLIKVVLRKVYADLALMEDILRASGLEWTAVRPPRLTNKPYTGTYRTAYGQNMARTHGIACRRCRRDAAIGLGYTVLRHHLGRCVLRDPTSV